jgi:putative tryptophan/tyrosine transport system substrate-binding protein
MRRMLIVLAALSVCAASVGTIGAPAASAKEVAVIWDTKSAMVRDLMMGFLPEAHKLAPDLKISLHRELPNMDEARKVFQECQLKVDGIVFLRSSGAEYLATVDPKVPCFVGACNNPAELGVIKNLESPEGKITGVTYFIPYDKRFDVIMKLFPKVKSVALLAEQGHPSGPIEQAGTRAECEKRGIEYKEVVASNLDDLLKKLNEVGKVDLIILSNTRLIMDRIGAVLTVANKAKIPIFSFAEKPVKDGAVAGIAADDQKLGVMLAQSVVDVVEKGEPVKSVPVKMDTNPKISVNEAMMKALGLNFPDSIMKTAVIVR